MRTAIDLVKREAAVQSDMQEMLNDMFKAQLPDIVEEVVHRNTTTVIDTVGETSKQSAASLEQRIKSQVVAEVMQMLEVVSDEVVDRVGGMLNVEPPV